MTEGGDMALEAHLSNLALAVKPEVPPHAAGIAAGMVLAVGLLIFALPFSDQIAISLSLLS
jgi:hypothetical protein